MIRERKYAEIEKEATVYQEYLDLIYLIQVLNSILREAKQEQFKERPRLTSGGKHKGHPWSSRVNCRIMVNIPLHGASKESAGNFFEYPETSLNRLNLHKPTRYVPNNSNSLWNIEFDIPLKMIVDQVNKRKALAIESLVDICQEHGFEYPSKTVLNKKMELETITEEKKREDEFERSHTRTLGLFSEMIQT